MSDSDKAEAEVEGSHMTELTRIWERQAFNMKGSSLDQDLDISIDVCFANVDTTIRKTIIAGASDLVK